MQPEENIWSMVDMGKHKCGQSARSFAASMLGNMGLQFPTDVLSINIISWQKKLCLRSFFQHLVSNLKIQHVLHIRSMQKLTQP